MRRHRFILLLAVIVCTVCARVFPAAVAPDPPKATSAESVQETGQNGEKAAQNGEHAEQNGEKAGPKREKAESAKEQAGRFLRLVRDDAGAPVALEAAVMHFAPADSSRPGPTVDLVAAVHVAEPSYYDELNRLFKTYDAVLYELVAPEGTQIPKGGVEAGSNPVSIVQNAMTNVLKLEFQLKGIDYTRDNFVHADMSPEQFSESMRRRGESMFQLFFRMMGYAMARQADDPSSTGDFRLLLALFDKNRALALKRVLAEQFEDLEGSLTAIDGPEGSTLIAERDKIAMRQLQKQVAAGKKKLAIFYGAGHMWDFEQRLHDELGLVPKSTRWLVAWNLKSVEPGSPAPEKPEGKPQREESPPPVNTGALSEESALPTGAK
jgi:hypothetical protein